MQLSASTITKNLQTFLAGTRVSQIILQNKHNGVFNNLQRNSSKYTSFFKLDKQKDHLTHSMQYKRKFIQSRIKLIKTKGQPNKISEISNDNKVSTDKQSSNQYRSHKIIKYNINNDKKITLPQKQVKGNFFKAVSSSLKKKQHQTTSFKKNNNYQNNIRIRRMSVETKSLNDTLNLRKGSQTFDFQYELQRQKQYFPRKKYWGSTKIIMMRQVSSKDKFTVTNTKLQDINKQVLLMQVPKQVQAMKNIVLEQQVHDPIMLENNNQQPKFQVIANHINTIKRNNHQTKSRQYKQIVKNKLFKSKTESMKKQQVISAWDSHIQNPKQESTLKFYEQILESYL